MDVFQNHLLNTAVKQKNVVRITIPLSVTAPETIATVVLKPAVNKKTVGRVIIALKGIPADASVRQLMILRTDMIQHQPATISSVKHCNQGEKNGNAAKNNSLSDLSYFMQHFHIKAHIVP